MRPWLEMECGACRRWARVEGLEPPVGVCEDVREAVGDDCSLYVEDVCGYVRAAGDAACEGFDGGEGDGH